MSGLVISGKERLETTSEEETRSFGRRLTARLPADATLLLYGDLGSGKTVVAQGIGEAIGLAADEVQSPSYTLIHEYRAGGRRLIHIDLYRLEPADLPALGLEELLAGPGLKVVEWAERIDFPVPGAWRLRLERGVAGHRRRLELELPSGGLEPADNNDTRRM